MPFSDKLPSDPPKMYQLSDDFPFFDPRIVKYLRWFREIGLLLESTCKSLRSVSDELTKRYENGELPDECFPGITSICNLPILLSPLLEQRFGLRIELYQKTRPNGGQVIGLTDDGRSFLAWVIKQLDRLDRPGKPGS